VAGGMAQRRRDAQQAGLPALSHEPSPLTA
jgi:hypothetical protein